LHLRRSRQQFSANCQLPTANCQLVANILFNQNLTGQSAPELC
jgi:hypothetical protein